MAAKAPSQKRDDVTSQTRDDDTPPKANSPGSPARFRGRPRTAARFKEREVARVVRAAKRAGGARVELALEDGRISIILGDGPVHAAGNELDQWMAKKNAR